MSTLFYTPGCLTADSRQSLSTGEITNDHTSKLIRFVPGIDIEHGTLPTPDRIRIGSGVGSGESIRIFMALLAEHGNEVFKVYMGAVKAFETLGKQVGDCTIVLVGDQALHEIQLINSEAEFHMSHRVGPLSCVRAWGSGNLVAHFLHAMFKVPPALAVCATSLIDRHTGGPAVSLTLHKRKKSRQSVDDLPDWRQSTESYVDDDALRDALTDHFSTWNVGTHPFTDALFSQRMASVQTFHTAFRIENQPQEE